MYHFKYHNVSKKPIYLSKLTTSCGCTVAKYDKKVVQPGEQGEIILVFHPMDQAGDLYREAFVYTDLSKDHRFLIKFLYSLLYVQTARLVRLFPAQSYAQETGK